MSDASTTSSQSLRIGSAWYALAAVLVFYVGMTIAGLTWGLPSREADSFLFPDGQAWSGQRMYDRVGGGAWSTPTRGADVDADPLTRTGEPVKLTATEADVAAILVRYRLYTNQPDEMITMRALASMKPGQGDLDPRLYQYGGLFIYPVGVLLKLAGVAGLIDVRGDVVWYLDHPEAFARFYVLSRAYAAAWGAVGLVVVWLIARRLAGLNAAALAALLVALLPVVVCMSHEGKPHLPGAALMLAAVWLAMRYVASGRRADWVWMSAACGAAFGMVLSSLPIFVLIPLAEWLRWRGTEGDRAAAKSAITRTAAGVCIGAAVYVVTNPYILINLFINREVLKSNFGNSLAMYEVSRLGEGFLRVLELTVEGASWPVLVLGAAAAVAALVRRRRDALPLLVPAGLIGLQFVLLGAGKPAEYGRFGVFVNAALAIGAACLLAKRGILSGKAPDSRATGGTGAAQGVVARTRVQHGYRPIRWLLIAVVIGWVAYGGWGYLANFVADAGSASSSTRTEVAYRLADAGPAIGVLAEPAPYGCPPLDFADRRVRLYDSVDAWRADPTPVLVTAHDGPTWFGPRLPEPVDVQWLDVMPPVVSSISWANKPFRLYFASTPSHEPTTRRAQPNDRAGD
jgi:hypothetical protein